MPLHQGNLLLVDDDISIRRLLGAILTQVGYKVRTVEDGFSALAEIRNHVPDVIVSDLNMPGMSGFELLSVIRRRFPGIRVVAMSSAFPSGCVPPGISADVFYEKGTAAGTLLNILSEMALPERSTSPAATTPAAIWLPSNGHDPAGKPYVTIACPECLRTFAQRLDETVRVIRETGCIHCNSAIQYAVVESVLPTIPPQRGLPSAPETSSQDVARDAS